MKITLLLTDPDSNLSQLLVKALNMCTTSRDAVLYQRKRRSPASFCYFIAFCHKTTTSMPAVALKALFLLVGTVKQQLDILYDVYIYCEDVARC